MFIAGQGVFAKGPAANGRWPGEFGSSSGDAGHRHFPLRLNTGHMLILFQKPKQTCAVFGLCNGEKKELVELPKVATNKDTPAPSHADVRTEKAEVHLNKMKVQRLFFVREESPVLLPRRIFWTPLALFVCSSSRNWRLCCQPI